MGLETYMYNTVTCSNVYARLTAYATILSELL